MKSMVYKRLPVNCGQVSVKKLLSVTYVTLKNRGIYRVSSILTSIYFFPHLEPTNIALLHRQVLKYLIHMVM